MDEARHDAGREAAPRPDGPSGGPSGPWVLLRSAYGGGFVEVVPRGQDDEYVVRVAKDGMLSFRSLLRLSRDGVWSYATQGYLNFRDGQDNDPRQHVRAHGNEQPFAPLRSLVDTARMQVERRGPVHDVLAWLRCPSRIAPWDWRLLLDAARAGACADASLEPTSGDAGAALRRAAHALRRLEVDMGDGYSSELADLANAYRHVLTEPKWQGTVDLQLRPCEEVAAERAAEEGEGAARPMAWLDASRTRLVVDERRCPTASYTEAWLPATLQEGALPSEKVVDFGGTPLKTDAVFVTCEGGSTSEGGEGGAPLTADQAWGAAAVGGAAPRDEGEEGEEGEEKGEDILKAWDGAAAGGEGAEAAPLWPPAKARQSLIFRLAPTTTRLAPTSAPPAAPQRPPLAGGDDIEAAASGAAAIGAAAAGAAANASSASAARLSVLLLMLDATSHAHLARMCPATLALLMQWRDSGTRGGDGVRVYEFPSYTPVGYNSIPNMVPLLAGVDHPTFLASASAASDSYGYGPAGPPPPEAVWSEFMRRGFVTFLLEEIHDGCGDLASPVPSAACKLFFAKLGQKGMPHHNAWQAFCSGAMRQCCDDPDSFLQPGRRQCVDGPAGVSTDLHELLLQYAYDFFDLYSKQGTPRMGLLNLMTAHEHFMHRLGILDEALPRFLRKMEPLLRSDSALFLLADHGTHGIWYNHFAVGQAEHRAPTLWLLLPARFVEAHPSVDGALRRNRKRRVTPYDLHATLRHLAAWPAMPEPTAEASSLFVDLPDARSCVAARVPAEWCVDQPEDCFE